KASYTPEERKLWADRLQRLLDGEVKADVSCHLIEVRLGADASTLHDRAVVAKEGDESVPIRVHELNEEFIEALNASKERPEEGGGGEPPPPEEPDGPKGPEPTGGDEPTPAELQPAPREEEAVVEPPTAPATVTSERGSASEAARPRALLGTAPGA